MSKITGQEFINRAYEHTGLPYKWDGDFNGANDVVTPENVALWALNDPTHFSKEKCNDLLTYHMGKIAGDCSGLVTHCLGLPKTHSSTLWGMCTRKGKFDATKPLREQIPQVKGLIVYRVGHIGIFRGDGYVTESGSTRYGVTNTKIDEPQTGKAWTGYGYLELYVDYETVTTPVPSIPVLSRVLRYDTPYMKGADVAQAQKQLNAKGFYVGVVDGVFGSNTNKATKLFQTSRGIVSDGIIGQITWKKLFE